MKHLRAFTLIEILVVATIIGLLAAVAVSSYSTLNTNSRDARRKADIEQIRAAIEMWRSNNNAYPTTEITVTCDPSGIVDGSSNTYLSLIPKDPKCSTNTYYYTSDGSDYTLGAYLEGGGTNCVAGQCGGNCNYCMGPYGAK